MGEHMMTTTKVIAYDATERDWVAIERDECSVCGQAWPCDTVQKGAVW